MSGESLNDCWMCSYTNASNATVCCICQADHTPSRSGKSRLRYHILTFGQRADEMPCGRLQVPLFAQAMQEFRTRTLCTVRVGVGYNCAIIIKDANGGIRKRVRATNGILSRCLPPTGNDITDFENVATAILATEPDRLKGKNKVHSLQ